MKIMPTKSSSLALLGAVALLFAMGCASTPYDYTRLRQRNPKSILVLPPTNSSTDVKATYSCLSIMTEPLAELGYYVFPVAVIDEMMKENGLPTSGEMHQAPLKKLAEILNPDAVMYISVDDYGTKFQVLNSVTRVALTAKLVDAHTGQVLWASKGRSEDSGSSSNQGLAGMLISAAVAQAVNTSIDHGHQVCRQATESLYLRGSSRLLHGPYHPEHAADFGTK